MGRCDELAGEVAAADVVDVAGDAEGRQGGGPVGIHLRGGVQGQGGIDGGCGGEGEEGSSVELGAGWGRGIHGVSIGEFVVFAIGAGLGCLRECSGDSWRFYGCGGLEYGVAGAG